MVEEAEIVTRGEVHNDYLPVRLVGIGDDNGIRAFLQRGKVLGEGESGRVREAVVRIERGAKTREYPVALKSYLAQDDEIEGKVPPSPDMAKARNEAYWEQLVYFESLHRMKAGVVPTFRLAIGQNENVLGIVMTNLELMPLKRGSEVTGVTTSKSDSLGSNAAFLNMRRDRKLAAKIGLALDPDAWMLQYSSKWLGIGKVIPNTALSDLIGVKIENPKLFKRFLDREGNEDLKERANKISGLTMKLS